MSEPRRPLFLERANYRGRRLADAARLLPVVGGFLFLLPILWQSEGGPVHDTTSDWIYFFAIWAALILAAGVIAPQLMRGEGGPADSSADSPNGGGDGEDG